MGGCLSHPSAVAAVPQLQAVKSPRLSEMEDQVQLIMLWRVSSNQTLGDAGRTGAQLPLQQCSLRKEGSPRLLHLPFQVSLWELELVCTSLHGGKER